MSPDPLANPEALIERVYSFVAYSIGPGADAEDVTSETFARAVRHRHQYDPARGKPLSWLLGIARRCLSDFRAQRNPQPIAVLEAATANDLEHEALARLALEDALATLGERDMELISLRHGADLSIGQIAQIVGMSPGAVRVALHRAHARLRAQLEHAETGPQPRAAVGFEPAP
jgi:RNA polymerase sigma-70 factor (ECF subfamily)